MNKTIITTVMDSISHAFVNDTANATVSGNANDTFNNNVKATVPNIVHATVSIIANTTFSNITNTTISDNRYRSTGDHEGDVSYIGITSVIILVISISAVIVNLPLCITLLTSWRKLFLSDIILFNIFFSNMLLGIGYSLPINGFLSGKHMMESDLNCNFTGYYVFGIACVNIGSLQALSAHQYVIIMKPMFGSRLKNRRDYAIYGSVFIWAYALLLPLPPLFGWSSYVPILGGFSCELDYYTHSASNISYILFTTNAAYIVPVILMAFCGYNCLFNKDSRIALIRNPKYRPQNRGEKRFTKAVFVMFLAFVITWAPYATSAMFLILNIRVSDTLHLCCIIFAKTSTITSSLIYFTSYRGSRHLQMEAINNCRRRSPDSMLLSMSLPHENQQQCVNEADEAVVNEVSL